MPNQTMQGLAGILAEQGRNGDTMLMHVAPSEVKYLADLGGITENPMTGLPEAFKFKDLLPFIGNAFLGPAFKAVGFSPGVSSFLATTASTMIGGGSLEKGIMSGLVSSSVGRLGRNLAATSPDAAVDAATGQPITDTGYKFGIFKKPETGTFGSRYSEAFKSPEFNPIEMAKVATEGGLDNFIEQIQKPGVLLPLTTGLGELARMNAEEDYIRQYQNFLTSQAERRKRLQTKYPQILPPSNPYYQPAGMAQGGEVKRKFYGGDFDFNALMNFGNLDFPELREFMASEAGQQYVEPSPVSIGMIGQEPVYQGYSEPAAIYSEPVVDREAEMRAAREAEIAAAREAEMMAAREMELIRQREQAAAEAEAARMAAMQREAEIQRAAAEAAAAERERQVREAELARQAEAARIAQQEAETRRQAEQARQEAERVAAEQRRIEAERQAEAQRQAQLEAQRQAELQRAAQLAEEARQAEIVRQQEFARQEEIRQAEAARVAAEAEAARIAEAERVAQQAVAATMPVQEEISGRLPVTLPEEVGPSPEVNIPQPMPTRREEPVGILTPVPEEPIYTAPATTPVPEEPVYNPIVTPLDSQPVVSEPAPAPAPAPGAGFLDWAASTGFRPQLVPDLVTPGTSGAGLQGNEKTLSDLLKDGKFQEAFKFAEENGLQNLLMQPDQLKNLRSPFTKDEAEKFIEAAPASFFASAMGISQEEFDDTFKVEPGKADERGAYAWVVQGGDQGWQTADAGYPFLQRAYDYKPPEKKSLIGPAIALFSVALAFAGVPAIIGTKIAGSQVGTALGLGNVGVNSVAAKAIGSAVIGAAGSALQGGSFEDALKAALVAAGFSYLGETALKAIKDSYLDFAAENAAAGADIANTLVTVADPNTVIVSAVNQAQSIAQAAIQGGAQVAAQEVAQPEVRVETAREAAQQPSVPTVVTTPSQPAIETPLDKPVEQVTVTTGPEAVQQPNVPVVVTPPPAPAPTPAPEPPVVQTPLDQVTVKTGPETVQQPTVPVVVTPPPAPEPPVVQTPLDQVTVQTGSEAVQQPNVPVVTTPPPAPAPAEVKQPLDQVTVRTGPQADQQVNVPVVVTPPPAPPTIETPLDEVVVTSPRTPIREVDVPVLNLDVVDSDIDLTSDMFPTEAEVTIRGSKPGEPELNVPTPNIPTTTPFVPPAAPTPINTPDLLDTLKEKGQEILTDAAIAQLLGSLAGGGAGGAGAGVGGGGGYVGTGGLGYIPEGQARRYLAAPGDYRHGFLPEWMFFENLNPPAVIDTTQPGTTPGGSPGTRPGTTPDEKINQVVNSPRGEQPANSYWDPNFRGVGAWMPLPSETSQPMAAGGTIKSYSPRGYLEMIQGYNEGGEVEDGESEDDLIEDVEEESGAPMTDGSRQLIPLTQAAILGQLPEDQTDDVIQKFIDLHGNRAFRKLREETLESVANGSRKEGMVRGHTGGMDDMVDGVIGSSERVAVSPGEFIVPADVVSMLGDGNSDSGRHKLEQMMSRVRKDKTGSTKQARPINSAKVLPA